MHHEHSTMTRRTLTAFYDRREDANEAIERLVAAGVARSGINLVEGGSSSSASSTSSSSYPDQGTGFWESLRDLFLPDEDRSVYSEGLRRGGYLLSVQVDDSQYDRALDILDDEGTVDIEQRQSTWRSEGWTPSVPSMTSGASGGMASSSAGSSYASGTSGSGLMGSSSSTGMGTERSSTYASGSTDYERDSGYAARGTGERDEVIPVAEEQLRVGKREVGHGRVRVRSYVVETPVQEQVNLRQERVEVERRPVDRALTGNEQLFQDRTIEVEERAEEAVVSKEARVKEELHIRKDVEEQTKTVSDTVRRTEVEVEDERSGHGLTGTTGKTGSTTDRNRR
jgi:uncharacterized protein (TIGR02271 family)